MTLPRILLVFLAITGAYTLLSQFSDIQFGSLNYWDFHGAFALLALAAFPRLTLLFGSFANGGLLWWLGWVFAPRVLVACLATVAYWQANPILVLIAWLVALGGESSEKAIVVNRIYPSVGGRHLRRHVKVKNDDNVIEAEVRHL